MLKSLLLFLALSQIGAAQEYEITIEGPIKIRVKAIDPVPPVPDPQPTPDPTPDPISGTVEVGPGKDYDELASLPPIAANTKIILHGREQPYRAKVALLADGIQLIGINRPVISGQDAMTPRSSPVHQADLQSSIVFTDKSEGVIIRGIDFRDCWESDYFALQDGSRVKYQGGSAAIRVLGGSVTVEDCNFSRLIHAVFSKSAKGRSRVTMKNCTVTNCGNDSGQRDEALYLEDDESTLSGVTIKDCRNAGTTCLHARSRQVTLKDCRLEGGGLLLLSESVSEANSPCLTDGELLDAKATIIGGKYVSRSASPFFSLRSDKGPDIAIRDLMIDGATLVAIGNWDAVGNLPRRFRRTIGTPGSEPLTGMSITYRNCTVGLLPLTEGAGATALEWLDAATKGDGGREVHVGPGNQAYIYEKNAAIGGVPSSLEPVETHLGQTYDSLKKRFLTED